MGRKDTPNYLPQCRPHSYSKSDLDLKAQVLVNDDFMGRYCLNSLQLPRRYLPSLALLMLVIDAD